MRLLVAAALTLAAPGCLTGWVVDGIQRPRGEFFDPVGAFVLATPDGERLSVLAPGEVEGPRPFFVFEGPYQGPPPGYTVEFETCEEAAVVLEPGRWRPTYDPAAEVAPEPPPGSRVGEVLGHDPVYDAWSVRVGGEVRWVRLRFEPSTGRKIAFAALLPLSVPLDLALVPVYLIGGLILLLT